MIDAGANPDSRAADGEMPLCLAAGNAHVAAFRELLRAKADLLLTRTDKSTGKVNVPLDLAAGRGHSELV